MALRHPRSNPERRQDAIALYRRHPSVDFVSGYLQANPNDIRRWLREAGLALPTRNSKRAKRCVEGKARHDAVRAEEVAELLRRWPRVA